MPSPRHRDRSSAEIRLRAILSTEFARRKSANPRYSLRALARSLNLEHSTVSQLLRGKRTLTWKSIRRIATQLRWAGSKILSTASGCGPGWNSRAIAHQLGMTTDEVNIALTDLCLFRVPEKNAETKGD